MQDLPPILLKVLNLGYLFLPLGLALVGGLCLLIAAARKTLTGGTALALGGLCGLIVAGSVSLGAVERTAEAARAVPQKAAPAAATVATTAATTGAQPASASVPAPAATGEAATAPPAKKGGLSAKMYRWASMGYAVLPLVLAALSALALLISVLGKTLNGASALALGGLCGVVVLGSVLGLRGTDGTAVCPLGFGASSQAISDEPSGPAALADVDGEQDERIRAVGNGLEILKAQLGEQVNALQKATEGLGKKSDQLLRQGGESSGRLQAIEAKLSSLDQQVNEAAKAAAGAKATADAAAKAAERAQASPAPIGGAPSAPIEPPVKTVPGDGGQ